MDNAISEQEACDSEVSNDIQQSAQVICSLCHDPKSKSPTLFLVFLQVTKAILYHVSYRLGYKISCGSITQFSWPSSIRHFFFLICHSDSIFTLDWRNPGLSCVNQWPPSWEQVRRSGIERVSSYITQNSSLSPTSISDGSEIISLSQLEDLVQSALNDFASAGKTHELNAFKEFINARFASANNVQFPCILKDTTERTTLSLETFQGHMYLSIRECQSNTIGSYSLRDDGKRSTSLCIKEISNSDESLLLLKYVASLPKELMDSPAASFTSYFTSLYLGLYISSNIYDSDFDAGLLCG